MSAPCNGTNTQGIWLAPCTAEPVHRLQLAHPSAKICQATPCSGTPQRHQHPSSKDAHRREIWPASLAIAAPASELQSAHCHGHLNLARTNTLQRHTFGNSIQFYSGANTQPKLKAHMAIDFGAAPCNGASALCHAHLAASTTTQAPKRTRAYTSGSSRSDPSFQVHTAVAPCRHHQVHTAVAPAAAPAPKLPYTPQHPATAPAPKLPIAPCSRTSMQRHPAPKLPSAHSSGTLQQHEHPISRKHTSRKHTRSSSYIGTAPTPWHPGSKTHTCSSSYT